MGLDMYLKAKTYVNKLDYKTEPPTQTAEYNQIAALYPALDYNNMYGYEVSRVIGYWRKANQIHKWFVDNCQGGEDNCREYYVGRNQLEELLTLCKEVQGRKDLAKEELPPQPGFFFGGTTIDDYYWADIDETIDQLTRILSDKRLVDYDFYYQSSW